MSAGIVPHLMTPAELADLLRLDVEKLYDMRRKGTGPAFVKIGRDVRYRRRDVDAWLDEHSHTTTGATTRGS